MQMEECVELLVSSAALRSKTMLGISAQEDGLHEEAFMTLLLVGLRRLGAMRWGARLR